MLMYYHNLLSPTCNHHVTAFLGSRIALNSPAPVSQLLFYYKYNRSSHHVHVNVGRRNFEKMELEEAAANLRSRFIRVLRSRRSPEGKLLSSILSILMLICWEMGIFRFMLYSSTLIKPSPKKSGKLENYLSVSRCMLSVTFMLG